MLTGENFKRVNGGAEIKAIKEKILKLKNEAGKLENINNIREYGFSEEKHDKLCKQIEWQEYLLWGLTK
jgi:hypothetical protein